MQCAARSAPVSRSRPARRARISFVPTPSVDAASRRRSSSAYSPAKPPTAASTRAVRVESTAARSRSTTASAFAIETPASAYVCGVALRHPSLRPGPDGSRFSF